MMDWVQDFLLNLSLDMLAEGSLSRWILVHVLGIGAILMGFLAWTALQSGAWLAVLFYGGAAVVLAALWVKVQRNHY